MQKRNADKIIRLLAYHVNGHVWKNGHFRHRDKARNYSVDEAVEAAELLGYEQSPPSQVFRKLHLSKLDAHVAGKIVCTAADVKNAIDFDLHGRNLDRDVPWGVVELTHWGHIIDVRDALATAAKHASQSHADLVQEMLCQGGMADEAEHVVVLTRRLTTANLVAVNNVEYFNALPSVDRKRILKFVRKHAKALYQKVKH